MSTRHELHFKLQLAGRLYYAQHASVHHNLHHDLLRVYISPGLRRKHTRCVRGHRQQGHEKLDQLFLGQSQCCGLAGYYRLHALGTC